MAKPELGLKRVCVSCGTKFYDLGRSPAVCPKCGTEQPAELPRTRRPAPLPVEDKAKKRPAAGEADNEADTDDVELEDVDGDDTLDDSEDLEDDTDEAIGDEIEVGNDRDEEN